MKAILSVKDTNEIFGIEEALRQTNEFEDISVCSDTIVALSEISKGAFDIAVFDLELFKKNIMETFSCIKDVHSEAPFVRIILLVNEDDDVMASAAVRFGIDCVITRPYDEEQFVSKVKELCTLRIEGNKNSDPNRNIYLEKLVSSILSHTGILPNIKGYKYLKEAIITGYNDRSAIEKITKTLYPLIAERNNASPQRVERAMRHAIITAWNKCGGNNFYSRMEIETVYGDKKPTNSEYICAVIEYLDNNIY